MPIHHGRPHIGANEVSWKNGSKIKKRKHAKTAVFLNGLWGERRYADQIFIQIYFRMHYFVVRFSKISSPRAARGIDPLTKIQRTLVRFTSTDMFMLAPLYHYFAPSVGAIYCDQCQCILYVCLSARLSQKLHCVCCPLKANVMYSKYFPPGTD